MSAREAFETISHEVDFCVVGGGMAGLTAAISAARHGARVLLMQDRPVFGGNASSECRVHVCGADRHNRIPNLRETGILEEMRLENLYRNAQRSFAVWDTVLYEKARYQENLSLLLNCSCLDAEMDGDAIVSVTGWQGTTQTRHVVRAKVFADCSGDGILAPLTGAEFRVGREAAGEFGESIVPAKADRRTMGMSCCFSARPHDRPMPFVPPAWAYRFDKCTDLPYGGRPDSHDWWEMGYWWIELGGMHDSIRDTEMLRDELLKVTYGVWDHIKNRCPAHREAAANWAMEWLQFLPAKRESRRFVGDHILNQRDIEAEGRFDDLVAYGGWTMDDHDPEGFWAVRVARPATVFHPSPSPFGIPYRCLYSRNVRNLMFAGRNASCTHAAMSSTRVMGTCSSMGQAVGAAAAVAVAKGVSPRDVGSSVRELQQMLLRDDAYLPWVKMAYSDLTMKARLSASQGDASPVRDGIHRLVGKDAHSWAWGAGDHVEYTFDSPRPVAEASLVVDSALDKLITLSHHQRDNQLSAPPRELPRRLRLDVLRGGRWETVAAVAENRSRLVRVPVGGSVGGVRVTLEETWGADRSQLFAFWLD